jgi:hypothetical protein
MFKNKVLNMLKLKKERMTGKWSKLQSEEVH